MTLPKSADDLDAVDAAAEERKSSIMGRYKTVAKDNNQFLKVDRSATNVGGGS